MNDRYIPRYRRKDFDVSGAVHVEKIFKTVQDYFGLTREDLMLKTKRITIAYPRQVCIYLLAKYSVHSGRGIAVMFGFKDTGSAAAAVKAIDDYLATDDNVKRQIEELTKKIKDESGGC